MKQSKDIVFHILSSMLSASPEASYMRLNGALRGALWDCIAADLPFQEDTFKRIFNELRGRYWFGDGAGSSVGEHYYSQACELNHATACQSFEQWAGRPGVLWEETAATPARLHVGSQFAWKGFFTTVTSMRKDSLVACSYENDRDRIEGLKVGAHVGGYRSEYVISEVKHHKSGTTLRLVKSEAESYSRIVAKRFTVSYTEIAELRKTEKARLKKVLDRIAACSPEQDGKALANEIFSEHFRHFELEKITAAFAKRKDWIVNEAGIKAWRNGANGGWLDVKENLLRVRADRVECSNGNSVSVSAVRRVLPIVMDRKRKPGELDLPLDGYRVNSVGSAGVKIDCTLVAWPEVERLSITLAALKDATKSEAA